MFSKVFVRDEASYTAHSSTIAREPVSDGCSLALHSTYYFFSFKRLWYQLCFSYYFPRNRWGDSYP